MNRGLAGSKPTVAPEEGSIAVLDMDWHMTDVDAQYGSGWTGYTWNSRLIGHVPNTLGCPSTSSTARSTLSGESSSTLHPSRESTPSSRAVLTDSLIRLEWSQDGVFEDGATQMVLG